MEFSANIVNSWKELTIYVKISILMSPEEGIRSFSCQEFSWKLLFCKFCEIIFFEFRISCKYWEKKNTETLWLYLFYSMTCSDNIIFNTSSIKETHVFISPPTLFCMALSSKQVLSLRASSAGYVNIIFMSVKYL